LHSRLGISAPQGSASGFSII